MPLDTIELDDSIKETLTNFMSSQIDLDSTNTQYLEENYDLFRTAPDPFNNGSLELLSPELRTEINKLMDTLDVYITSTNYEAGTQLFYLSRQMLENPPENLNERDTKAWKAAVDVMGYSADYWLNNFDDWYYTMIGQQKPDGWLGDVWKKIKGVVISDAAGAATGFARGFIKTGTWQGAGAAALIGGVSASAGTTVKKILKAIF